ncbi:MAG: hypothetical protein RBS37_06860 [Bacteroidales bacterium]|jgi:hypothetical protein|nr:hypothetical protein [Bacteroidales bacterium]
MERGKLSALLLLISLAVISCRNYQPQAQRIAIARAGDKTLFYDQIPGLIQPGMSAADSTALVQNYINKWAKREILKLKAIENLTPEFRTEVEGQIDEIRTNLLIHRYQQQMINQKLDTLITEEEIESHYASNESTFVLNTNIVKALFIRVPLDIPNITRVAELYRSDSPDDRTQLQLFCYQYADRYDDFGDDWIPFNFLVAELPLTIDNQEEFLRRNTWYETSDSTFRYFVRINDYRLRSATAPYDYVKNNIRSLILNSRKMAFLQDLETGVFNEAIRSNKFITYQKP